MIPEETFRVAVITVLNSLKVTFEQRISKLEETLF